MLPEDAPVKEQFTLEHYQPTNRAQPTASYFPEKAPQEIEEIIEELPEEYAELPPAPIVKNKFFPNLFKVLALITIITTVVVVVVYLYQRENSRTLARQFNQTLATNLTAVDASLSRVDMALADLLLALQKPSLADSAPALVLAVKSGKIAVIQSWQNLDDLKIITTSGQVTDIISPTETYLTETQKTFSYYEQFSALQQKASGLLAAVAGYQNNPGTDTSLTATSLNNFANDFTTIKGALSDLNDNLPFALSSFHEENLRSITTWLSLLGNVNAAVYEKDQDKTMTATLQLVTSLNSWTTQSQSLSTEFFRANKTLQKYFYLAPLYQSTIASLQLMP